MPKLLNEWSLLFEKGEPVAEECTHWTAKIFHTGLPAFEVLTPRNTTNYYNNGWPGLTGPADARVAATPIIVLLSKELARKYSTPQFNEYGEIAP